MTDPTFGDVEKQYAEARGVVGRHGIEVVEWEDDFEFVDDYVRMIDAADVIACLERAVDQLWPMAKKELDNREDRGLHIPVDPDILETINE